MDVVYRSQPELLLKDYTLGDSLFLYSSVIASICACKMVYHLSQMISTVCFKSYSSLSKPQQIEWNKRAISTFHAVFITTMSLYLVFWSDLFSDNQLDGFVILRSSTLSTFVLGVSVGFFLSDLGMIIWFYPSLGRMEHVIHHLLSVVIVAYTMLTREGQLYTYMFLMSVTTTPCGNLRWYLDTTGMKRSSVYLMNAIVMTVAWLVARILLFIYTFYHIYLHYDQATQIHTIFEIFLILSMPLVLGIMNLMNFPKILKGLKKTLAKRH